MTAHRLLKRGLLLALLASLLALGLPVGPVVAQTRPPDTRSEVITDVEERPESAGDPDEAEAATAAGAVESDHIEAPIPFSALGIHADGDPNVQYRVSDGGTDWSDWETVEPLDAEDGPDPGSAEARGATTRPEAAGWSSDSIWTGEATHLQLRVENGSLDDLEVHVIDSMGLSESLVQRVARAITSYRTVAPAEAYSGLVTRAQWGANESWRTGSPSYATVRFGVLHHTAGTNSYTQAESPGIVRGIYHWHTQGNGWSDIGYNILVDRYGTVYEGRYGGVDRGVIGAHAGGWNTGSFGVSIMGNFEVAAPTVASIDAATAVIAWKYRVHGLDSKATARVTVNGQSIPTLVGHRDVGTTACPGRHVYSQMDNIRTRIETLNPPRENDQPWGLTAAGDATGSGRTDIITYEQRTGSWWVNRSSGTAFSPQSWERFSTRDGWSAHVTGDFTGNGRIDTASFHPSNGTWWVNRSSGSSFTTQWWATFWTRTGWAPPLVGDFNRDGRDDIASYHPSNGTWWVSTSTGDSFATSQWGRFSTRTGWQARLVGDFNGDGRDDIASYHPSNGRWWVSISTGSSFSNVPTSQFATLTGWGPFLVGDFNGDGRDQVAAYHSSNGRWWVSSVDGGGWRWQVWEQFSAKTGWATHLVGDFDGDGKDDIASFHPSNGSWWVSRSSGTRFSTSRWGTIATHSAWNRFLVGDFNRDGRDDVATYRPTDHSWWVGRSTGSSFQHSSWSG